MPCCQVGCWESHTDPEDMLYIVMFVYGRSVFVPFLRDLKGNTSKTTLRTNDFQTEEPTLLTRSSHAGKLFKCPGQLSKQSTTEFNIGGTHNPHNSLE